jgi:hypothetical protein
VHHPEAALALTATVQEAHEVALHLICLAFDAALSQADGQVRNNEEVAGWTT